jgi:hypothetical protein
MGRLLVSCLVLTLPAQAAEPKASRLSVSQSARWGIRLLELGEGQCKVEVTYDNRPAWEASACPGTAEDLYFISNDGERFWVVFPLPDKRAAERRVRPLPGKRKRGRPLPYPPWSYATVAALYTRAGVRAGAPERTVVLNELVRGREGLRDVRQLERTFKWLEGAVGVRGKGPRVNEDNRVELDTVERRDVVLSFY